MKASYIKTHLKTIISISKIVTIHYYEFDKSFAFEGESHDFWEMVYVDKGKVAVRSEAEEMILSQGEIIFHKPNEFHAIRAYDSEPNFFVISFVCSSPSMACFEGLSAKLNKSLKPFMSAIIEEAEETFVIPKNTPSLKKLTKKNDAIIGGEQLIKTYLEQFLILLLRDVNKIGKAGIFSSKEVMDSYLISSIKTLINENLDKNLRLDDICKSIGYSKSYLCKIFGEQTGKTIASYTVKSKIKKAKELIRKNDMNFSEISDSLSFDNPQYFSRVFKRVTGMTPTEFKKTLILEL